MMSRRRALLVNIAANSEPKPYTVRVIGSKLLHEATNTTTYSSWYISRFYSVDEQNGAFTLDNSSRFALNYSSVDTFNKQLARRYCILDSSSGSTMYYFPEGSIAEGSYDEATGIYSVTAYGKIQVFTIATSS